MYQMAGLNGWMMLILLSVLPPAAVATIPVLGRRVHQEGKRMGLGGKRCTPPTFPLLGSGGVIL
jgi:hypothetical protein